MSLSHLFSYRGVSSTSLTACQILVQCIQMETDLFRFIPGGTPFQMNLTKSQKNVLVRVRYGRFENLKVVSGCKETVLLC